MSVVFSVARSHCFFHSRSKKKDKDKLFKSFSQINQNNKINEGTGLGLIISKELVNLMGGNIWLEYSEINKGSNFCFTIKIKECNNYIDDNRDIY